MKKTLLFIMLLVAGTFAAKAQTLYESDSDIYGLNNSTTIQKTSQALEIGILNEFEIGYRFQRNFNQYLSWDVLGVKYAYDFKHEYAYDLKYGDNSFESYGTSWKHRHEMSIATGVRAFTPRFGKFKAFAALDFGFQGDWTRVEWRYGEYEPNFNAHFLTEFTIGFQCKSFYFGYGLSKTTGDFTHLDNMLRLGYNF